MKDNGWSEYKRLVISKIDELTVKFDQLHDDNIELRLELARLKTKATIWGGMSGLLCTIIVSVILHNLLA